MTGKQVSIFAAVVALMTALATPASAAEPITSYVRFLTDLSKPIPYPATNTVVKFSVELSNPTKDAEDVSFTLLDSQSKELDFDFAVFPAGGITRTTSHSLTIAAAKISKENLPLRIVTKVTFSVDSRKQPQSSSLTLNIATDINVVCKSATSLTVAKNACPAGSVVQDANQVAGYVNFLTDLRRSYPLTTTRTWLADLEIANPNNDISQVELLLKDAGQNELASTYIYPAANGGITRSTRTLRIVGPSQIVLPIKLITTVKFAPSSPRGVISSTTVLNSDTKPVAIICQDSKRFLRAVNRCPAGFTATSEQLISDSDLTSLGLNANQLKGRMVTFYACIRKATTTANEFSSLIANQSGPWISSRQSALLKGNKVKMSAIRKGQALVVRSRVTGINSKTGLPALEVLASLKVGSC